MKQHKVVITGTGRCGTTFLVALLTECGVNTGYKDWMKEIKVVPAFAGLENPPHPAYVLKSPYFIDQLERLKNDFCLDHILIPIRNTRQASLSRLKYGKHAGGLAWGADRKTQEKILTQKLLKLMTFVKTNTIPWTQLDFESMTSDPSYLFQRIGFLLGEMKEEEFLVVFKKVDEIFKKRRTVYAK